MANVKVSEMPQANTVNNSDNLMIVQQNVNKKVSKQVLLQEINNSLSNIEIEQTSQNTNIAELQEENENLRNAMLQVNGEGTNITLNGTSKNKFTKFVVKGNTSQGDNSTLENSQTIHNVSGDLNVKVQIKNLFDINSIQTKKYIKKNNGDISNSDNWSASDYIPVNANTQYIYSGITNSWSDVAGTCFYDENKEFISSIGSTAYTFITPVNAKYVRLSLNNETPINVMLEKGTTATPYVAHQEQNLPFTLSSGQKLMEGDYLASDGIHHTRVQAILTGTETAHEGWRAFAQYEDRCKCCINGDVFGIKTNPTVALSNYYQYKGNGGSADNALNEFSINNTINITGPATISSLEEFKSFVNNLYTNNTPIIIESERSEELVEPYTQTQQSQYNAIQQAYSYAEQTNISSTSTDLSAELEVSAVADMNTAFQTLQSRVDLLEG